jgi:uncharacterized protein YjbI with pentapeptide repeats
MKLWHYLLRLLRSKRWDELPRWLRWMIVGMAAVAVVLAAWALLVPVADWLARHDVGAVRGPLRTMRLQTARDAARGRLLTLGAGLFAIGALVYTARNYRLSREGQVTDRYTNAIGQLGSDKLDVRIGGIYALERIARDSKGDHPVVIEVLTAFVREHSREQWPPLTDDQSDADPPPRTTRPDVQAALTVIGRRTTEHDSQEVNLQWAILTLAHLDHAHLNRADLDHAHLTGAYLNDAHLNDAHLNFTRLDGAHFHRAYLHGAHLTDAHLDGAHLGGAFLNDAHLDPAYLPVAFLDGAHLTGAYLTGAHLDHARLDHARLTGAHLDHARLPHARLNGADLSGAHLHGAYLHGAYLHGVDLTDADLTGADLTEARWSPDVEAPEGWERDTDSGLLRRVGGKPPESPTS